MQLKEKKLLITGISSNRSLAYGIAKACAAQGASLVLTYNNERFKGRLEGFAAELGAAGILQMDAASDESIQKAADSLSQIWPEGFDDFAHSIAWAPREAISGAFLDGISREGFLAAMSISVYSFAAMAKAFLPLMQGHRASLLTLTYYGGEKVVPNYNTMGVAKAALECTTRYMASELGPLGIRVNAISCGPVKTLAASGIKNFGAMLQQAKELAPTRELITLEDCGRTAAFLFSDAAAGITAETLHLDGGLNSLACVVPPKEA